MEIYGEKFGLTADRMGFESSLVSRYNQLLGKPIDVLTAGDIAMLIRQKMTPEFVRNRAIEMLSKNPFAGELWAGELLSNFLTLDLRELDVEQRKSLSVMVERVKSDKLVHDWGEGYDFDAAGKSDFFSDLTALEIAISKSSAS